MTKNDAQEHNATYCGYANYETWCLNLWLNNEERIYRHWKHVAEQTAQRAPDLPQVKEGIWTAAHGALFTLADELNDRHRSLFCNLNVPAVCNDLLQAALDRVDWGQVAAGWLEESFPMESLRGVTQLPPAVRFPLGQTVCTPGAIEKLTPEEMNAALRRHSQGDWGDVVPDDAAENDVALREGFRLFSVYHSNQGIRFWVITEADRSVTTVLLPEEY